MPPSYIRVRAVVWVYGRGHTDTQTHTHTQTRVTTIHFESSTTHAKCNNNNNNNNWRAGGVGGSSREADSQSKSDGLVRGLSVYSSNEPCELSYIHIHTYNNVHRSRAQRPEPEAMAKTRPALLGAI